METPNRITDFWDWLTKSANDFPPRGDTRRTLVDDGTEVNLRPDSESGGPTIEVVAPGIWEESEGAPAAAVRR
ncbi:MAG: hypothetical protein PHQ28_12185 [Mycobacterium sp.]|nr:hypothetical protein [Mycobacterium sp.]